MLDALAAMARRSTRSQADLRAAMRKRGLSVSEPELDVILVDLAAAGLVENLIPLADGTVLLTVTTRGILANTRCQ